MKLRLGAGWASQTDRGVVRGERNQDVKSRRERARGFRKFQGGGAVELGPVGG